jgi:hypothetical protein
MMQVAVEKTVVRLFTFRSIINPARYISNVELNCKVQFTRHYWKDRDLWQATVAKFERTDKVVR